MFFTLNEFEPISLKPSVEGVKVSFRRYQRLAPAWVLKAIPELPPWIWRRLLESCILPAASPVQIPLPNLISLLLLTNTAYAPPLNVASLVNVEAPDTLTLSKFVWPSTSISPSTSKSPAKSILLLASILPSKVDTPVVELILPIILIPCCSVCRTLVLL